MKGRKAASLYELIVPFRLEILHYVQNDKEIKTALPAPGKAGKQSAVLVGAGLKEREGDHARYRVTREAPGSDACNDEAVCFASLLHTQLTNEVWAETACRLSHTRRKKKNLKVENKQN